ncbi:MAG: HyaD/HybD family hydrogenase maturation endopeptidase [Candidatus Omnitrophica bacterium]|nr:HyaD/HybD family hydrogenase maturation endopeptidase [Candidatus Omnitrophota bacterium]
MENSRSSKKISVLGLGNILLKDEGFGIHLIRRLQRLSLPDHIELIDGGTCGLDALALFAGSDKLIILDAIAHYGKPATIYRISAEDLLDDPLTAVLSLHQVGALETISIAKKTGKLPPKTVIIGIEPKQITWGLDLSKEIAQKVPQVIDMVLKEIGILQKVKE